MGNDDTILPLGFVCDPCNQYFGSKLEQQILQRAPFGVERVAQAIKSKKGRYPRVGNSALELQSTGYWDRFTVRSNSPHSSLVRLPNGTMVLNPQWATPNELARFLLKVGLGLLALADTVDPYAATFDAARSCARFSRKVANWDFALGLYPNRSKLTTLIRSDHLGPLETRQIYQYELGIVNSGDVILNFVFATNVFAVNLSRPPILEYVIEFNRFNSFSLKSRWQLVRTQQNPARGRTTTNDV